MTTYLSVGTNQLIKELHQPIKNGNPKPNGGLWATINDENYSNYNPWIEYLSINPHIIFYKNKKSNPFLLPAVLITLKESAKIFMLKNINQMEYLKKYYPTSENWIDFEKLSEDYDGIFIDLTELYKNASKEDKKKIASFSVSSLILFNLDCIKHYQQATVDIEPFDYEYEREFIKYEIKVDKPIHQITELDSITKEFIDQIKKNFTGAIDECELYQKYGSIITDLIRAFREKTGCIESPETLKCLLVRNITHSI